MSLKEQISIAVPVYNEEEVIEHVLKGVIRYLKEENVDYEIVVVNDGSTDRTGEILKKLSRENSDIRIIKNRYRKGVGYTLKKALYNSRKHSVFFFPADGEQDIKELPMFFNHADITVGVRKERSAPQWKYITSYLYRFIVNQLFGKRYPDINWVKLIKKEVLNDISLISESAFLDSELLIEAERKGYKVDFVNVTQKRRAGGYSKCNAFKLFLPGMRDLLKYYRKYRKAVRSS